MVTSSRPPGRLRRKPDDRTSNAGVAVRTGDGSQQTADAGDEQCLHAAIDSSPKLASVVFVCRHHAV